MIMVIGAVAVVDDEKVMLIKSTLMMMTECSRYDLVIS